MWWDLARDGLQARTPYVVAVGGQAGRQAKRQAMPRWDTGTPGCWDAVGPRVRPIMSSVLACLASTVLSFHRARPPPRPAPTFDG